MIIKFFDYQNKILRLNSTKFIIIIRNGKIWEKNTASCRNPLKRFDKFTVQID